MTHRPLVSLFLSHAEKSPPLSDGSEDSTLEEVKGFWICERETQDVSVKNGIEIAIREIFCLQESFSLTENNYKGNQTII